MSLAARIFQTTMTFQEASTINNHIWIPQILYCLPITTFMNEQCTNIYRPMLNTTLSKQGYNQYLPQVLIHGPIESGGLGLQSL